jgi:hypothetical protein
MPAQERRLVVEQGRVVLVAPAELVELVLVQALQAWPEPPFRHHSRYL